MSCGAAVVRSFLTFEALPLVEFRLAPDIPDQEALQLLDMDDDAPSRTPAQVPEFSGLLPPTCTKSPETQPYKLP